MKKILKIIIKNSISLKHWYCKKLVVNYFINLQEGKEKLSSVNATGIAMLFSAGTFLYVATVHVLPELSQRAGGVFRANQLFALVLGAMLPLLLTMGHHH